MRWIAKLCVKYTNEPQKYGQILYGLEILHSLLVTYFLLLLLGIITSTLSETFIIIFSFSIFRFYAGGKHFKTKFRCTASMLCLWLFSIFCHHTIVLHSAIVKICYISCFFITLLFAPSDTNVFMASITKKRKLMSTIVLIFYIYCIMNGVTIILYPTIIESLTLITFFKKEGKN